MYDPPCRTPLWGRPNRRTVCTVRAVMAVMAAGLFSASTGQAQTAEQENMLFRATVTSVEVSPGANGWRYVTGAVHLQNLTKKPLVLAVDRNKVIFTDDRRNTYGVTLVRGLGEIAGTGVDAKFVLPAGGGGDALFEARWRGDRAAIFGLTFDLTLPVRVVVPLEGGQVKLDAERIVSFSGLKAGYTGTPKGASLPKDTVDAGPFTMQITQFKSGTLNRRWHSATLSAKIKNTSDKPITLAYESGSSFGIDDLGNRFGFGVAGTYDTSVSGIGVAAGTKVDPQLVLAPGESRDVQFTVLHQMSRDPLGTMLTYYVALVQLETLPGNQIRAIRQYSLAYPRMAGLH